MQCHTAYGPWAIEFLQFPATPPVGSEQWNSCSFPPHHLWAVGTGTPAMHCHTTCRRRAGTPIVLHLIAWVSGRRNCCHGHGAWGQWVVELLGCTATLPLGIGQWNSCSFPPSCLWAVGGVIVAIHRHAPEGHWAVEFLQCTATLPGDSGQCNSYNAPPYCRGALGNGTSAVHRHTACGQWAWAVGSGKPAMHRHYGCGQWEVKLLQCTATLLGGSGRWKFATLPTGKGQRNSCNLPPHCLWVVGSGNPAMHCHNARGQWAVKLLHLLATLPVGSVQWNGHCKPVFLIRPSFVMDRHVVVVVVVDASSSLHESVSCAKYVLDGCWLNHSRSMCPALQVKHPSCNGNWFIPLR